MSLMMRSEAHAALPLQAESYRYCQLRQQLLAEIPDLDAESLADTLEGISDLNEMLAEVIRSALEDEALAEGLSTRLKDMKARLERLSNRAERKRQLALRVMSEAEIQKLTVPDLTASLKQGAPTLEVRDEACFYSTKVRITVRAGDATTVREGIGTGFGRAQLPELAHDVALKAAETALRNARWRPSAIPSVWRFMIAI